MSVPVASIGWKLGGPIMSAPCKTVRGVHVPMHLQPIAVEFDFMHPVVGARDPIYLGRQERFYVARKWRSLAPRSLAAYSRSPFRQSPEGVNASVDLSDLPESLRRVRGKCLDVNPDVHVVQGVFNGDVYKTLLLCTGGHRIELGLRQHNRRGDFFDHIVLLLSEHPSFSIGRVVTTRVRPQFRPHLI